MGRILLADDDADIGEIVSAALMERGHAVGVLPDGKSALDTIRRRPPDLVILDCNMPHMAGADVLRAMKLSADLYTIPVLMLTGRRGANDENILRFDGAADYMRKPFDPLDLIERAEKLMNRERGGEDEVRPQRHP